jgi:hypothetical protein
LRTADRAPRISQLVEDIIAVVPNFAEPATNANAAL